jgi:hypothetical protein
VDCSRGGRGGVGEIPTSQGRRIRQLRLVTGQAAALVNVGAVQYVGLIEMSERPRLLVLDLRESVARERDVTDFGLRPPRAANAPALESFVATR